MRAGKSLQDTLDASQRLLASGNLREAEVLLDSILAGYPEDSRAYTLLGIVYAKTGRLQLAEKSLASALARDPDDAEALGWLANTLHMQRRAEEAVPFLKRLVTLRPAQLDAINLLGMCLISSGRAIEAEEAFRHSIRIEPNLAPIYANLGLALRLQNRGDEALIAFKRAVELDPAHVQNHIQLFKQLQQLSRWDEAIEVLRRALISHPGSVVLSEALALAYGRLGRNQEAEPIFKAIAASSPAGANSYAQWLQDEGRFEESATVSRQSLKLRPVQGAPYRSLVEAKQYTLDGRPILEALLTTMEHPELDEVGRMHLSFAMGKVYEKEGKFEQAMQALDLANSLAYRIYPGCRTFDPQWTRREPDLMAQIYSAQFMNRLSSMGAQDSEPIFIVGMIRSGTTLLDQVVSSHPMVSAVGEATFWNSEADSIHPKWKEEDPTEAEIQLLADRYLASIGKVRGKDRFTDKMPLNYRQLGLIHVVLPKARFLHIRRDPFDTCMSIYSTFFGGGPNFAYSQENIVAFYRSYLCYMHHWRSSLPKNRFYELDYEALVTDPETETRRVIEFLDLPWDSACLRHESNKTQVSTPSRWQARQPIYTSSMNKRMNFVAFAKVFAEL